MSKRDRVTHLTSELARWHDQALGQSETERERSRQRFVEQLDQAVSARPRPWNARNAVFGREPLPPDASPGAKPGYAPTPPNNWETCEYTGDSLTEFVRDYLGPTLAKQGMALPIITPETDGWTTFDSFASSLVTDPVAMTYVGPIATAAGSR